MSERSVVTKVVPGCCTRHIPVLYEYRVPVAEPFMYRRQRQKVVWSGKINANHVRGRCTEEGRAARRKVSSAAFLVALTVPGQIEIF